MGLTGYLFLKLYTKKCGVILMPKKPVVRTLMEIQHAKGCETLL